jgi:hypothetical protein
MPRPLASNEHLDYIAALLDDIFRIPGTKIRFGLDALIGWVPGIGDAMTGIASFLIVFASWRRGAKAVTLVRMIANVLLETAIGSIPVAGDVFHVMWKATTGCCSGKKRSLAPMPDGTGCSLPFSYSP